jgi:hypothetical protein
MGPPGTSSGRGVRLQTASRIGTTQGSDGQSRPMTSISAANYSSRPSSGTGNLRFIICIFR